MQKWIFIAGKDSSGNDIKKVWELPVTVEFVRENYPSARAFNTLGFIKSAVTFPLIDSPYFGPSDGIYIDADILPIWTMEHTGDYSHYSLIPEERKE